MLNGRKLTGIEVSHSRPATGSRPGKSNRKVPSRSLRARSNERILPVAKCSPRARSAVRSHSGSSSTSLLRIASVVRRCISGSPIHSVSETRDSAPGGSPARRAARPAPRAPSSEPLSITITSSNGASAAQMVSRSFSSSSRPFQTGMMAAMLTATRLPHREALLEQEQQ